jgi:hypothetical protein
MAARLASLFALGRTKQDSRIRIESRRGGRETVIVVDKWPSPRAPFHVSTSNELPKVAGEAEWSAADATALGLRAGGGGGEHRAGADKGRILYAVCKCGLPIAERVVGAVALHVPEKGPLRIVRVCTVRNIPRADKAAAAVALVGCAVQVAAESSRAGGCLDWEVGRGDLSYVGRVFPDFGKVSETRDGAVLRRCPA